MVLERGTVRVRGGGYDRVSGVMLLVTAGFGRP